MKIGIRIVHPPPEGPKATLESVKYMQKGIRPINCALKLWSWVNQGKLNHITIKHEFRIALIVGAIEIKEDPSPMTSMVFDKSDSQILVNDINEEQDRMLN